MIVTKLVIEHQRTMMKLTTFLCCAASASAFGVVPRVSKPAASRAAVSMQFEFKNPFENFSLEELFGMKKEENEKMTFQQVRELCRDEESSGCEIYDLDYDMSGVMSKRPNTKKMHAVRTAKGIAWEPDYN